MICHLSLNIHSIFQHVLHTSIHLKIYLFIHSIFSSAMAIDKITDDAKQVLSRFRADNQITDSDHNNILRSHEWTGEDYRNGYRR